MSAFLRWLQSLFFFTVLLSYPLHGQEYKDRSLTRDLGNRKINCLVQDRTGFLWVGTEDGLFRFDFTHFVRFEAKEGLGDSNVVSLQQDSAGRIWVGTRKGLFVQRLGGTFLPVAYKGRQLLVRAGSSLSSSPNGSVIAAAEDGLFAMTTRDDGRNWDVAKLLPNDPEIRSVLWRKDGSILFGCGDGVCFANGRGRQEWGREHGLPADQWLNFLERSNGEVWVRSRSHVAVLAKASSHFELRDLPGTGTSWPSLALAEDTSGNVLAGLGTSIAVYSPKAEELGQSWRVVPGYGSENTGRDDASVGALLVDRDGSVWLGTLGRGLANWVGMHSAGGDSAAPPPPVVARASYGSRDLLSVGTGRLPFDHASLDMDLASLTSRHSGSLKFRYRLLGLDNDWKETSDAEIHYPELPAGAYRLEVVAVDGKTRAESSASAFAFEISPQWWATKTSAGSGLCLLGYLGVLGWKWRRRRIESRHSQLESLVAEQTEELDRQLAEQARPAAPMVPEEIAVMDAHDSEPMIHESAIALMTVLDEYSKQAVDVPEAVSEAGVRVTGKTQ